MNAPLIAGRRTRPSRCSRNLLMGLAIIGPAVAAVAMAGPASAEAQHNSVMNTSVCVSVPYTPGDCSGFTVSSGTTVQMQCFQGGPQAMGQGKWFEITVLSGPRYGLSGEVPAPSVSQQWLSAPHC